MKHANSVRFTSTCARVGVGEAQAILFWTNLESRYSEANRSYHNLMHVDRMLDWLDCSQLGNDSVELAIWFHDSVYEPMNRDNELQSALYFRNGIGALLDDSIKEDVERLILATDLRSERSQRHDESLMIDVDLSILASEPQDYQAYCQAIRQEYQAVPDSEFTAGRSAVLRQFLANPIYATGFFAPMEAAARRNIEAEVKVLTSGSMHTDFDFERKGNHQ
jgi:predicted metal-dependent HD superfamily phosphohydrolase